jgi:hypothetical protein
MPPSVDADRRVLAYRVPRGVVAGITPWNWPYTMQAEVIAPALASGNAVVWVPAPTTSTCAVKLADCIVAAELPAGVFNLVTGPGAEVGDEIAGSPGLLGEPPSVRRPGGLEERRRPGRRPSCHGCVHGAEDGRPQPRVGRVLTHRRSA